MEGAITNLFVSDLNPVAAARNLDANRIHRMSFEAYEALCAALLNIRHGKDPTPPETDVPYKPRLFGRRHNIAKWIGADRWHAQWTLAHAHAAAVEGRRRYRGVEYNRSLRLCHKFLEDHLDEWPVGLYAGDYDPRKITFHGAFNYDWFRWTNSPMRPGHVVLHPDTHLVTRYRLSLLHKWLYLDKRPPRWVRSTPPLWAFKPVLRDWINERFGVPSRPSPELALGGAQHQAAAAVAARRTERRLVRQARSSTGWNDRAHVANLWIPKLVERARVADSERTVVFSAEPPPCSHRYYLSIIWQPERRPLVVIMANPSTADHLKNDRTVERMERLARRLQCGGLIVLNVYALRSTQPQALYTARDPAGAWNNLVLDWTLRALVKHYGPTLQVILAWGEIAATIAQRTGRDVPASVLRVLKYLQIEPQCLEISKAGQPKHPLYLSAALNPQPYRSELFDALAAPSNHLGD